MPGVNQYDEEEATPPWGAYITGILLIGVFGLLIWLLANYPNEPTKRPLTDDCESITKPDGYASAKERRSSNISSAIDNNKATSPNTTSNNDQEQININRQIAKFNCQLAIYTRDLAFFTKLLVGATAGLIVVGLFQWRVLRISSKDMRIFQRAYLSVEPMGIEPFLSIGSRQSSGLVGIKNSGNLPATEVKWAIHTKFDANINWRTPNVFKELQGDNVVTPGTMMRQGSNAIVFGDFRGTQIYIYGRVSYNDGFTGERWVNFCHRYNSINIDEQAALDGSHRIAAEWGRYHRYGNAAG
jgi:hypothetical protein